MKDARDHFPAVQALAEAFDPEFVGEVRGALRLAKEPVQFARTSSKTLLMLYAARCGSTFASQLLSNLPAFGRMTEWFQPEALARRQERQRADSDDQLIQDALDAAGTRVFAAKCLPRSIVAAALMGFLDQYRDSLTFVLFKRRDDVAQAVSLFKGRLTGRYHGNRVPDRQLVEADYDHAAIADHRTVIGRVYDRNAQILTALGHDAPTFFYEDIVADPQAFVTRIAATVDVSVPDGLALETRARPIGDSLNRIWVERFRTIEAERR